MAIRVALTHRTRYEYDRPVRLSPHEVRLRPAPHTRVSVLSYSLRCEPEQHYLNWQQDAVGNYVARFVFPEPTQLLEFTVDLVVDLSTVNPFDFFVQPDAQFWPFEYDAGTALELAPCLQLMPQDGSTRETPATRGAGASSSGGAQFERWIRDIREEFEAREKLRTVDFIVELNRRLAARIAYQVRMEHGVQTPEQTLELGIGSCRDSAWLLVQTFRALGLASRFVSGYLIQLVPDVKPLEGPEGPKEDFTDLHAWAEVFVPGAGWIGLDATSGLLAAEGHVPLACTALPELAAPVSGRAEKAKVSFSHHMQVSRLAGPPRVSKPYSEAQWSAIDALGDDVDRLMEQVDQSAAGPLMLTMGGEPTFVSLDDRESPQWLVEALGEDKRRLAGRLFERLHAEYAQGALLHFGLGKWYPGEARARWALTAIWRADGVPVWKDRQWLSCDGDDEVRDIDDARRLAGALVHALHVRESALMEAFEPGTPSSATIGFALPLEARRESVERWHAGRWPIANEGLQLIPGDSPMGLRLPLDRLPETAIRTTLCVELRDHRVHVFLPPVDAIEDFLALVAAVELSAAQSKLRVRMEGYPPPMNSGLRVLSVTPDPGVIEVNAQPSASWRELVDNTTKLYEIARECRLSAEKFTIDGRQVGTGGGHHLTLGGATTAASPFLREPALLRSLIGYWQNHPSLSYLFAGQFVGPTSQAPRIDEARSDSLYELSIAFQQMQKLLPTATQEERPELVDRLLRNLLTDVTGNTHRAEFSIDKMYSSNPLTGKLGLLEMRAFDMPPNARMCLVQALLVRALVARFWRSPWQGELIDWGTGLHDRWMLPHYIERDLHQICQELRETGIGFQEDWLHPFLEFRFPRHGRVQRDGITLELRQAIEPWNVLAEEMGRNGTARYVDSSVERLQVHVKGIVGSRHRVTCNGRIVPLQPTQVDDEFVAGVRFRAWAPPSALHGTIGVHAPLRFDIVDTWASRSIGGCVYHVTHPGGRGYDRVPVNAKEAEARRMGRFQALGHTPGPMALPEDAPNPSFPVTLDLRYQA